MAVDPPWWSGQPSSKAATAKPSATKNAKGDKSAGSWGEKVYRALGGGGLGPDKSNINSYPEGTVKYVNPNPKRADDKRSTLRKLGDELLGRTVGGNEIRYIDRSTGSAPPKGPKGPKGGKSTSAVAAPKRTVVKAGKVTAPSRGGPMKSQRMEAAGYTTSAPSSAHSGFTFGSKSSAGPKVAAAKKTKVGASHNVARKSLFKTRKD